MSLFIVLKFINLPFKVIFSYDFSAYTIPLYFVNVNKYYPVCIAPK